MFVSFTIRIVVAALAAFVFSAVFYGAVVGAVWHELSGVPADSFEWWQPIAQVARNVVVASALSYALLRTTAVGVRESLLISLVLWLGFQAMAIIGAVIHEGESLTLYFIHTFDALMTAVVMTISLKANLGKRAK